MGLTTAIGRCPHYLSERLGEGVNDLITKEPEQSGSFCFDALGEFEGLD